MDNFKDEFIKIAIIAISRHIEKIKRSMNKINSIKHNIEIRLCDVIDIDSKHIVVNITIIEEYNKPVSKIVYVKHKHKQLYKILEGNMFVLGWEEDVIDSILKTFKKN